MRSATLRISLEELALAFALIGKPELGQDTLRAQLGALSQEEARARSLASGHSLMARGWLNMDAAGNLALAESFSCVVHVLARADFSLQLSCAEADAEYRLTYHFSEGAILEHALEQGVVHRMTHCADAGRIIRGAVSFFELSWAHPFSCPLAELPAALLDDIKDEAQLQAVCERLEQAGVPQRTRMLLAQDLHDARYRGSILRVEYGADNAPRSDRGLLLLRGQTRFWLLRPFLRQGEAYLTTLPGARQVLQREIEALLEPQA